MHSSVGGCTLLQVSSTRWLVCCYASPAVRLLRCVAGHLDPSEEAFPYALATLDALTVSLLRG